MNEIIYLEPDEDITGVIVKVKEIHSDAVSLVIPRGGTIAQSVVNLKLMKREIEKMGKSLSLVTKDKISKNLASQVGVTVYPSVSEAKNFTPSTKPEEPQKKPSDKPDGFSTAGIKINQYSRDTAEEEPVEETLASQPANPVAEVAPERSNVAPVARDDEIIERVDHGQREQEKDEQDDSDRDRIAEERHTLAHAQPVPRVREEALPPKTSTPDDKVKHNVSSRRKPLMIIGAVLLIVLIAAGSVLYPSAQVKMTLATEDLETTENINLDKALTAANLEALSMPAKEYLVEKSAERDYPATGKKDIGEKASGEITFYNSYDNNNSVVLPNGTVLSASGKTFILDGQVTIPQAEVELVPIFKVIPGQIKGKVIARDSGEASNIAPAKFLVTSFAGTKQEKVYGQSTTALTGGTTHELKIVSDEDIQKAQSQIKDELTNSAKEELAKKGEEDQQKLIVSSIAATEVSFSTSKASGDESETFKATSKIKVTELAYSEIDLKKMAMDKVRADLKSDEMLVSPTDENVSYDLVKIDSENGKIAIKSSFRGKVGKKFDAESIKQTLVKSKYGTAESKLESMAGVKEATVSIKPGFWPLLPFLAQRISVSFDYQKE